MHNTNKIFPRSDNSNMVIVTLQKTLKIKKMPTAKEDLAHGVLQNKTNKKNKQTRRCHSNVSHHPKMSNEQGWVALIS